MLNGVHYLKYHGRSPLSSAPSATGGHRRARQRARVLPGVKALRSAPTPLRGAAAWTPAPRTLVQIGPWTTMPSQTLPSEGCRTIRRCEERVVRDTCTVSLALVPSRGIHCRKALPVNSLHELRATLDQHGTRRHGVDLQHEDRADPLNQDHVDPPDQSRHETRTTGAHETRATPPTRQIPTTPAHPIRATATDESGGISSRKRSRTGGSRPAHETRNDQITDDGNGARERLAPVM